MFPRIIVKRIKRYDVHLIAFSLMLKPLSANYFLRKGFGLLPTIFFYCPTLAIYLYNISLRRIIVLLNYLQKNAGLSEISRILFKRLTVTAP